MSNKQSSVEWLFQNMFEISQTLVIGGDTQYELMKKAFEQAKAKHEDEIKEAWDKGDYCIDLPDGTWEQKYKSSDQYYNETFGNNQTPTPDPKLIDSMAMRYRHDFGLLSESEKESIRITMKQIWEETAGIGFYKP